MNYGKTLDGAYDLNVDNLEVNESSYLHGNTRVEDGAVFEEDLKLENELSRKTVTLSAKNLMIDSLFNLPPDQGSAGQVLSTNGLGDSAWSTIGGTGGVSYVSLTGIEGFITVNGGHTASSYTNIPFVLSISGPLSFAYGGTGLNYLGSLGQVLTATGSGLDWESIIITVPDIFQISGYDITLTNSPTGTGGIVLEDDPDIFRGTFHGHSTFTGSIDADMNVPVEGTGFSHSVQFSSTLSADHPTELASAVTCKILKPVPGENVTFTIPVPDAAPLIYGLDVEGGIFTEYLKVEGDTDITGKFGVEGLSTFSGLTKFTGNIIGPVTMTGSLSCLGLSVTNAASIATLEVTVLSKSTDTFHSSGLETLLSTTTTTISSPTLAISADASFRIISAAFNVSPTLTSIGTAAITLNAADALTISSPFFKVNNVLFQVGVADIKFTADQFSLTLGGFVSLWTIATGLTIEGGGELKITLPDFTVQNAKTTINSTLLNFISTGEIKFNAPKISQTGDIDISGVLSVNGKSNFAALATFSGEVNVTGVFTTSTIEVSGEATITTLIGVKGVKIETPELAVNDNLTVGPLLNQLGNSDVLILQGISAVVLRSYAEMSISSASLNIEASTTLSGDLVLIGALVATDIDVATIACGNLDTGDVVAGDIVCGAIECLDVACADIEALAIECVNISCAVVEAGILFGLPL